MAISREDNKDIKKAYGSAIANAVSGAARDSGTKWKALQRAKYDPSKHRDSEHAHYGKIREKQGEISRSMVSHIQKKMSKKIPEYFTKGSTPNKKIDDSQRKALYAKTTKQLNHAHGLTRSQIKD